MGALPFRKTVVGLVAVLVLSGTGCGMLGLGGGGDGEIGMLEFGDPPPTPDLDEFVAASIAVDPVRLVEVQFLYSFEVRLETMQRVVRDLLNLLEYGSDEEVDLEWVIEVHEVTEDAEDFFRLATAVRVPEPLREQYDYLLIGLLDAVQVTGFGSDRVLAAAVAVGPSGRDLFNMPQPEVDGFLVLMREAKFFLNRAERSVEEQLKETRRNISRLRMR